MPAVDLNCDVGEAAGDDTALLQWVTSANIACGGHAGDEGSMRATARAALEAGVAIGAHPGYEDFDNFGRRELHLPDDHLTSMLTAQLEKLAGIVASEGAHLEHVKPHGALYNQAAFDTGLADVIAETVAAFDPGLRLVGLAGSEILAAGVRAGLEVAGEGFADRSYRPDGTLSRRTEPGALVTDPDDAVRRAVAMATGAAIPTADGAAGLTLRVDTICIHGDSPGAAQIAAAVREALERAGVAVEKLASF